MPAGLCADTPLIRSTRADIQSRRMHPTNARPQGAGQVGVWHTPLCTARSYYDFRLWAHLLGCAGLNPQGYLSVYTLSYSVYTEIVSRSWAWLSFSQSKFTTKNFRKCCSGKNPVWIAKVNALISSKAKPNYTYAFQLMVIFLSGSWHVKHQKKKKSQFQKVWVFFGNTLGQVLILPEFCPWLPRTMIWSSEGKCFI